MRKMMIMICVFCLSLNVQANLSEETLAKLVTNAQTKDNIQSGIIVIAIDGKIRYQESYGYADREKKSAITVDSFFPLGSISKQFTASLILKLAQEKKLDLQAPLNQYLDHLPAAWQGVTVHQLLTHTSGIPECVEKLSITTKDNDACYHAVRDLPLLFSPGSQFAYSNINYVLLAKVIAKLTGESYSDYWQQTIQQPLHLNGLFMPDQIGHYSFTAMQTANLVKHYQVDLKQQPPGYLSEHPASLGFARQLIGAGELVGNANDLIIWTDALFNGKVISKSSLTAMQTKYGYDIKKQRWYGYGLCIKESAVGDIYFHMGKVAQNGLVISAYLPSVKLNVIVLSNVFEAEFNPVPFMNYALGLTASLGQALKEDRGN